MSLTQTWGALIGLSFGSTVLGAVGGVPGHAVLAAILLLAWIKAHLILKVYLGLGRVPQVLRGFDIVLGLVMIAMMGLGVAG